MSKRFATIAFVVMASILIVSFLFILVLFLLPGVYLFGVKYIAGKTHISTTGKFILSEHKISGTDTNIGPFSGIILNAYEVPVYVIFTEDYSYDFEYYDNYNGITTSKINNPSINYSKDEHGNAVIDISEYHTFLFESSVSDRYVKIYIPMQDVAQNNKYKMNLTIKSTKSNVNFSMSREGYITVPTFNNLTVETNGEVNYNTTVSAINYTHKSSNSITIDENADKTIKATNYDLTSTSGKILVLSEVTGDLRLKTKLGRIKLISCMNLTAETSFGDIGYAGDDDGSVTVNGIVNIKTRAGSVTLGNVRGETGLNSITTSSGKVSINTICDGSVTTQRGQIEINSVREFTAKSSTGKITISEAKTALTVSTTRGNITLGGDKMKMKDINVTSTLGKVIVKSATGNVNIETISSNVVFQNTDSKNINIKCGGKISASGLRGNVDITAEKAVESLTFTTVTEGNTNIKLGANCTVAYVYITATSLEEVSYYVTGSKIEVQEWKNNGYQNDGGINFDSYVVTTSLRPNSFVLNSENAHIYLRYSLTAGN